jgi:cob(I)alamin adenosyltransferase
LSNEDVPHYDLPHAVPLTGRGDCSALQDIIDTVSEMKEVKHAYKAGIQARKGVDH